MAQKLTKVDKARIKLWTSREMAFMISKEKGVGNIPRFTECEKVPYDLKIRAYLDKMETQQDHRRPPGNPKAVCVKLMGQLRYVWRTDVLTEAEYEEVKKKDRSRAIRVFGQKPKGDVGEGGSD